MEKFFKNDNNIQSINNKIVKEVNLVKSIKSNYIIKRIFINIIPKIKLGIIKYNKTLQNKLGINFEYFKIISGKYKINGINGEGEEYTLDNNIKIFEGEYLNNKRNGKGKELTKEGKIIFEGEYLNGKKNGKGKEYNPKGEIIFEGEY